MIPSTWSVCQDRTSTPANNKQPESADRSESTRYSSAAVEAKLHVMAGTEQCTGAEHLAVNSNPERNIRKLPFVEPHVVAAFEQAIQEKNLEQLLRLAVRHPSLIEQCPQCLSLTGEEGKNLFHRMCESGRTQLIRKALNTEHGKRALCVKDNNGDTGLHLAAQARATGCLDCILACDTVTKALLAQNREGLLPLHIAILRGHINSSITMMDKQPDTLVTMDNSGKTPLHCLEFSQASEWVQLSFLKRAIEMPCVQEKLNHFQFFLDLHSSDAQCEKRIQQLRKSALPAPKPVIPIELNKSVLSETTMAILPRLSYCGESVTGLQDEPVGSVFIQAMDLASTVSSGNKMLRQGARQTLQRIGVVGVYGAFSCMPTESERSFTSLGDENVSVQLVNQLVALGAPNIQLRLSQPRHCQPIVAKTAVLPDDDAEELHLERLRRIELNKLALLLPGFDPGQELPQRFAMGNSTVSIVKCNDSSEEPAVVFSFLDLAEKHQQHAVHCDHYMVVKPYRFESTSPDARTLYTDFDGLNVRKIPLRLPPDSLLPEVDAIRAFSSEHDERQWLEETLNASSLNSPLHARGLGKICALRRLGQIHINVIYGLHHPNLSSRRETLLRRWIDTLQANTVRAKDDKPILILIGKAKITSEMLGSLCKDRNLVVIDTESAQCDAQLDQFSDKNHSRVAIGLLPELPKPVFHHLMTVSNLPVLAEGANTTSFLLQTGHSYLSLLPDGETPIPRDMGYPLEALKIEAHSYKLRINKTEQNLLENVYSLTFQERYQEAINCLDDHKIALADLRFLYDDQHSQALPVVSVRKLLEKGIRNRLGKIERTALLAAINPSMETLAEYVDDCLDSSSIVVDHFALQRMHVRHDFNNALIATLNKFARIKHLQ